MCGRPGPVSEAVGGDPAVAAPQHVRNTGLKVEVILCALYGVLVTEYLGTYCLRIVPRKCT